jgi:single-stranded DNA-specific DHH superfamily exonuclease
MELMDLSRVLATLPSLTAGELDAVIAASCSLRAQKPSGSGRSVPAKQEAKKKKKNKGPAKLVSRWAGNAEYSAFKAAEKELRSFLKAEGKALRDYPEDLGNHPAPVAAFYERRNCWFRAKAELSNTTSSPSARLTEAEEEVEEEKKSWADRS